ncbi:MAG: glycosyltransferase family 4 protein [Candidatus Acidiferrales bacterium]
MRVLFLGLSPPYPPLNGHRLRTWAMVRALAANGHQITVLSFADPEEEAGADSPLARLCEHVELIAAPRSSGGSISGHLARVRSLVSPLPHGAWRFRGPVFERRVKEFLHRSRFDVVLCDGVYNMVNVPEPLSLPLILNKDDVAHVIIERYMRLETNPIRKFYASLERRKVRAWEASASRRCAAIWACSNHDRALLEICCPGARVEVIPNVVDTVYYAPADEGDQNVKTILFQGGMDWYPNRDAVNFFVSAILPILRPLTPGATFTVAGRSLTDGFQQQFAGLGDVRFTGTVPEMRTEIAKSSVCVVPLRIASGTRLKILEAAAMSKPIVSTHIGAEGLDFTPGAEILLADKPKEFAEAVATLLKDGTLRKSMGQAARRRVEKEYSIEALQVAVRDALATIPAIPAAELRRSGRGLMAGTRNGVSG